MSYNTVQFDKVFEDVVRASGRPAEIVAAMTADEQERVCDLINPALREFWERGFWPGTFAVEARDDFDSTGKYVLKQATGKTPIGLVDPDECFYAAEPDPGSLKDVLGMVEDRGDRVVCFDPACPDTPYLRFQLPCPTVTRTAYDDSAVYAQGAVAYDGNTGECYASVQDGNLGQDLDNTDWWEAVEFPALARTYVKLAASAEWMAEDDGKYKQAARARRELEDLEDRHLPVYPIGR